MRAIVVGAGPGGSTAALELARGGAEVWLFEKSDWPRAKTCGDGVSPLGLRELAELGVDAGGVLHLERALVTTPRETAFRGGWPNDTPYGTIVERRVFDAAIVDAAISAGARFIPGTQVRALERRGAEIVATVRTAGEDRTEIFDAAIVGDGATGGLAAQLGFPPHRSRLVAIRGYVDALAPLVPEYGIFYDREISPGYGWIFPLDERRANVGIIVDESLLARRGGNLRALLVQWLARSPICRTNFGAAPVLDDVHGGVIPSGRSRRTLPGVFLIGDAAGVADPFTAEGIFEAIRSARSAARALLEEPDAQAAATRYEAALAEFDRNERAARALRFTFPLAIEPFAALAAKRPALAARMNTDVFFLKTSFLAFMWRLTTATVAAVAAPRKPVS